MYTYVIKELEWDMPSNGWKITEPSKILVHLDEQKYENVQRWT